ncbi:MAG TPA: uroporphyrinogen decarboxylase family protein [Candidatus Limnocylindria bacterium]|jgi:uroporphyrinogen decarboxylase|nr:uroporphyrinogen decarboxylase family protein [Candidatus Limnocylindria bacterium]
MNARERVTLALSGHEVDRVPFAVWRHFYPDENEGAAKLAETTIAFTKRHQLDLIKFNPRAHYHAEPWGTRYHYAADGRPVLERYAVTKSEHWSRIRRKTMREPAFREVLYGLRLVREVLPDTPLLATIFTPLGVLERLAGKERVLADLRTRTDEVVAALDAVSDTFAELAAACCEVADGIFLATTSWARRDTLDEGEYRRFGTSFDLRVLAGARGAALNVLHVCGPDARVVEVARYPVAAVSWNPRLPGNPDLAAFLAAVPARGAIGGFSDDAFLSRATAIVKREAAEGLAQTAGKRWLAAGGCTIPVESRLEAIDAARDALRG